MLNNPKRMERIKKWTLVIFLERAKIIYGEYRFDYSKITSDHIKGSHSCVPVKCIICNYSWDPQIVHHIN